MATTRSSIDSPLAIEIALRQEKVGALRRVGDTLEKMLGELKELERQLRTLTGPARAKPLAAYHQLRADAEYQRWCLVVQREAMGLFNHSEVDLMYPVPPQLK
ncbi:hypothetical protein [Hyalangium gracile]|uniref:hypothetical protein n=1 Tax=Hyalangium gracile TaxID=394092 RepID=UPI001CCD756E|nr:hypothetical protein [Hyalangium gracile]